MKILAEMMFSRDDSPKTFLQSTSLLDGSIRAGVGSGDGWTHYHTLPIQQVIQLRDFLNRHIDRFALQDLGADASRASDDPGQLPAVAEIPAPQILHHPV